MRPELSNLEKLLLELEQTNSKNDKIAILKKYKNTPAAKVLLYVFHPFWNYGVSPKNCQKNADLIDSVPPAESIFDLLDSFKSREFTGHAAIARTNKFVKEHLEHQDVIWKIVDRNLKSGIDATLINKAFGDKFIPEFSVALADKYDDKMANKIKFNGNEYYASRKADGCRVLTIINSLDDIKCLSRAGNEFTTLEKVKEALREILPKNTRNLVFDGEMCIVDENDKEDFTASVSQIKRKNVTIDHPRYMIFDMLTLEEFTDATSERILVERLDQLNSTIPKKNKVLAVLEQVPLTQESFEMMQEKVKTEKWEGLILRRNTIYCGRRSKDLLKVKSFFDAEYVVKGVKNGTKHMLVKGKMVEKECLAGVFIDHKGFKVQVGSGFSDDQRIEFYEHPERIIGKTITVQYFSESSNASEGLSLRFPVIKAIYPGPRNV